MALTFAVFLCLASGFLLVSAGWTRIRPRWADVLLRTSLTVGLGPGVFSVAFFLYRVFDLPSLIAVDLAFVLPVLCGRLLFGGRGAGADLPNRRNGGVPGWFQGTLAATLSISVCAAVYAAIRQTLAHPHGDGWDAFAIWNLHARFLSHDSSHWRDGFTPLLPWSHPDYPLLLPASVAHFWGYLGYDSPMVPAVIGLCFTFGTVVMLFAALAAMRGWAHSTLAAIALLATPSFIEQGTWQYADVPLSFFFLGTVVLLCLQDEISATDKSPARGLLFLGGLSAGFAAWTKNEGILFVGMLVLAWQWTILREVQKTPQSSRPFLTQGGPLLAGILPILIVVVAFKHWIGPPGDLFSDIWSILERLRQPLRYWIVLQWFGKEFLRFGDWLAIAGTLLLGGLYYLQRRSAKSFVGTGRRASTLALALTFAGYALIYLITPYEIYWHLRFSLGRLFLQLWPATIFLVFLLIPAPDRLGVGVSK